MRINAMNTAGPRGWVALAGVAALAAAMGLGGCDRRSGELVETTRALQDRNVALQQEVESLQAANASLQASIQNRDRTISQMQADREQLASANAQLLARLQQLDEGMRSLKFGQLDPATDAALRQLAAQYPDLVVYDSDRGMIRFTSDLTFASGSADVTPAGRQSLQALARILQAPEAMEYDIRIVGHTDSQPISSRTAQRHPTNMHLSAHRAISVFNELRTMGVAPQRIEVAGRGEYMPAVPNTASGNTPQNRRVEIFVVRSARPAGGAAAAPAPASAPAATPAPAPRPQDDLIK